ncbi:MAG: 3-dehydroquinate synthase [Actinobacteria bacterium]|nr:3-dehydroquinate synthase [Actinomycetota bacterium]
MKPITVNSERSYQVSFTDNLNRDLSALIQGRDVVIVSPKSIVAGYRASFPAEHLLIEVADGEEQKSIQSFGKVSEELAAAKLDRNCLIVAVGGGATTDLAGFLAASYLRGVEWIAIPTSLAGMVDAAIGGKTGLNLSAGKNLIGAFHSPSAVLIDQRFLSSLSERDLKSGMAEVAKCGFIDDTQILNLIGENWRDNLSELIYRSIAVKAKVVSDDFKESNLREILNYGHTLGHAIEKHSKYFLRHGEAVALGLRFAAQLSFEFSGLSSHHLDKQNQVLDTLELNAKYPKGSWPELLEIMRSDKKVRGGRLRFVTLSALGVPTRAENITDQQLEKAFLESIGE